MPAFTFASSPGGTGLVPTTSGQASLPLLQASRSSAGTIVWVRVRAVIAVMSRDAAPSRKENRSLGEIDRERQPLVTGREPQVERAVLPVELGFERAGLDATKPERAL